MTTLREAVESHYWFHSIDFGDGLVSAGVGKTPDILKAERTAWFTGVNFKGASVLDVGAWNGYYTLQAYQHGARHVTALDSFTWEHQHWRGRETFDLVMGHFGLQPRAVTGDIQEPHLKNKLGSFDVALFLGVFYHLVNPLLAIQNLAAMTKDVLVMETHTDAEDYSRPAMVFYPGTELGDDASNWWGPNRALIVALLKQAGFPIVEMSNHPLPEHPSRAIAHAYKSEAAWAKHRG